HLVSQVAGHRVDVFGEIFPDATDALHLRLAAQLALGTDFARDARHFGGKCVELVHHRVDGLFELQNLAFDVSSDLARQVTVGNSRRHLGDVTHLTGEVTGHRVDAVSKVLPRTRDTGHNRLASKLAFGADLARY